MSAKDSVGDKLVASIQKTKAEAAGQPGKESKQPAANTVRKAPAKKASAKKAASKSVAAKPAAKKAVAKKKPASAAPAGAYQSNKRQLTGLFMRGRRVWPD